jgi:uncharacterized membrane protein YjjB (DUF3815 family)
LHRLQNRARPHRSPHRISCPYILFFLCTYHYGLYTNRLFCNTYSSRTAVSVRATSFLIGPISSSLCRLYTYSSKVATSPSILYF